MSLAVGRCCRVQVGHFNVLAWVTRWLAGEMLADARPGAIETLESIAKETGAAFDDLA
jgi:hypothetical protein